MKRSKNFAIVLLISIALIFTTNSVYANPLASTASFTEIRFYPDDASSEYSISAVVDTYDNLYASVQGETNANAAYMAFAEQAAAEGYPEISRLFIATADAEMNHANDEWAVLESMGATDRPMAAAPTVGSTADNLQAAFDGETYEYTVMYPSFLAEAESAGLTAAARIFRLAMRAEEVHAGNYSDVMNNLGDAAYITAKYAVVYRCPVCGEVVTERPDRCPICGAGGSSFVMYSQTYFDLYASVQGETNANAAYMAFAEQAAAEGYPEISRLFIATADAEMNHANDEWAVLESMGATDRPMAAAPTVGSTADNLQAAFDGETYEYTVMYPGFLAEAENAGLTAAARIFRLAMRAEEVHAGNYSDVKNNLGDAAYITAKYSVIYRCPVCGEVVTERPDRCPICGAGGSSFVMYSQTYFDLYASVQGETNANAAYMAFAEQAAAEGYPEISRLFIATADAEMNHANDEWAVLESMGATNRPMAAAPTVGSTADNLQAAFDGETYEYTVMYPGFLAEAENAGLTAAARIFRLAMRAEEVHAGNYSDVKNNLGDAAYITAKYSVIYRCPVCGEVVTERPDRCPICGAGGTLFIIYAAPQSPGDPSKTLGTAASISGAAPIGALPADESDAPGNAIENLNDNVDENAIENIDENAIDNVDEITIGNEIDNINANENANANANVDTAPDDFGGSAAPASGSLATLLDKSGSNGYASGYPDNTFRPDADITRYEVSVLFYALILNEGKGAYASEADMFNDVLADQWYSEAVGYLAVAGIINGYEDGAFKGDNPITRAEFAKIAASFAELNLASEISFSDVPASHWAYDYIKSAYNNEWIVGYPDGSFGPDQYITRAEAITIINRILGLGSSAFGGEVKFTDISASDWFYNDVIIAAYGI